MNEAFPKNKGKVSAFDFSTMESKGRGLLHLPLTWYLLDTGLLKRADLVSVLSDTRGRSKASRSSKKDRGNLEEVLGHVGSGRGSGSRKGGSHRAGSRKPKARKKTGRTGKRSSDNTRKSAKARGHKKSS